MIGIADQPHFDAYKMVEMISQKISRNYRIQKLQISLKTPQIPN